MRTKNLFKRLNSGSFLRKVGAILMGTALIASTNLSTAALANNQGERQAIFNQLRLDNPDAGKKELHQLFKQEWRQVNGAGNGGGGAQNAAQQIQNQAIQNVNSNHLNRNDFSSKAEWQAAKQQLKLEQKNISNTINQTVQQGVNNHVVNVNAGFALDLTSAVQSITLGDKLFKSQESVTISIGGQEKTLSAGSKVTAAEYVAAKQAMGGGSQTVTLDADGRATGGSVDLSAMTSGNKTMKVSDLTVPVAVTASGDFGKGGDVKITGDLTNSGAINAYSSNGKTSALIKADNITNNAGASIVSSVSDLTLRADDSLNNYGDISATGNLTLSAGNSLTNSGNVDVAKNLNVFSPNVTNSGNLASANGNITFDTPVPAAMNINNTNGTVSALNGAINIREAGYNENFNTVVNGGDLLSKELNVNSGLGTADLNVGKLTGTVNETGFASHVTADTDVLNLGNICLTGDPTYYNTSGSINIAGNITSGEYLAIIARDNITSSPGVTITAANATQGFDVWMVAGANITGVSGGSNVTSVGPVTIPPSPPETGQVTVNGASANGGNITLGAGTLITTRPTGGVSGNGGQVYLNAFADSLGNNGSIDFSGSTIQTGAYNGYSSGYVRIWAGNSTGTAIKTGAIDTTSGSQYVYSGGVEMRTANITGSSTWNSNGQLISGGFGYSNETTGTIEIAGLVRSTYYINIESIGDITSSGSGSVQADRQIYVRSQGGDIGSPGQRFSADTRQYGGLYTNVGSIYAYDPIAINPSSYFEFVNNSHGSTVDVVSQGSITSSH